jgi:hypothetical protein
VETTVPLIRYRGRLLLLAALVAVTWVLWPRSSAVGQPSGAEEIRATELKFHGAGSCSSMACHNFNGPEGDPRSEYSTWANGDKHSKAFTVLHNDRSVRIVRNLASDPSIKKKKESAEPLPATEQPLCLKCHATNDGNRDEGGERFVLEDGVGCEVCHGASQKYFTTHYLTGFKELTPEEKETTYGLRNLKDLGKRADLCISCHVGSKDKEVNHDLIAAGHPRLNFELAGYHGIAHKHWQDADEVSRNKDFYARLWAIGQVKSAKAALDLLAHRATGVDPAAPNRQKPWPEFSEYACYACHKDLKVNSPRQRAGYGDRTPGSMSYGTWYLAALPPLSDTFAGDPKELSGGFAALRKAMQQPAPNAAEVKKEAEKASRVLDGMLKQVLNDKEFKADRLRGWLTAYANSGIEKTGRTVIIQEATDTMPEKRREAHRIDEMDWDEATQLYLSMAALSQALTQDKDRKPALIRPDMLAIKERLKSAFPKNNDSPQRYDPLEKPSQKSLLEYLTSIRSLLGN